MNFRYSKKQQSMSIFILHVRSYGLNVANAQMATIKMTTKKTQNNEREALVAFFCSYVQSFFILFHDAYMNCVFLVLPVICVRMCARFFLFCFSLTIFFSVTGEVKRKFFVHISQFRHRRGMAMMSALLSHLFTSFNEPYLLFILLFVVVFCFCMFLVFARSVFLSGCLSVSFVWTVVIHPICLFRATL